MFADLLPHLVNGVSLGLLFALIALGFMLIVGVMETINLAHGSLFALGMYAALFVAAPRLGWFPEAQAAYMALPLGTRYAIALFLAPIVVGAFRLVIELALPNVEAVIARVEDFAPPAPFDVVISRAFSDLATFAQASARHLAPGGRLVAMKGVFPDEEIALLPPAFRVVASPSLSVPGLDAERHLIVMERA